ncbi:hypothetical protein [Yinghuangia soli]|uniref:Phage tail tape measure protein n=1 Tax=Yinghuangia soli TaxID=2908204 RepID=A0AA41Q143_9ACTN|nr:hypothetical protein [Yinghuangia soli]MCF2529376.1 hypothetical protein [Yinghuangia soli]
MGRPATLAIRVTADARQAEQEAQRAQGVFGRLSDSLKGTGGALLAGAGLASFTGFLGSAVSKADQLNQAMGGIDAVFKESAGTVKQWGRDAAQSVGLSATAYDQTAAKLGASLKNQGVAQQELAGTTDGLIKRAADLASVFGGTTQEAVEALGAAFRGEADPAERYGLNLSQTAVNAYKSANAQRNLTDVQARMELLFKQSADSAGNFAKESSTLEGQQQRLNAQWENMQAALGQKLLPVVIAVATWFNSTLLPGLKDTAQWLQANVVPAFVLLGGILTGTIIPAIISTAQWFRSNLDIIVPVSVAIGVMALALGGPYLAAVIAANVQGLIWVARLGAQAAAQGVVTLATGAWTAAQWLLNVALNANPIGLVIAAIAALAAGIYIAYQRSETFRAICDKVWSVMKAWGSFVGSVFIGYFNLWKDAIGFVVDNLGKVVDWLGRINVPNPLGLIRDAFDAIKNSIGWATDKANDFLKVLGKIPGVKAVGNFIGSLVGRSSASATLSAEKAGTRAGVYEQPFATRDLSLIQPMTLFVNIDGAQLQGRISRTVRGAMLADGARYAARGWA